jgi:hypothetical protein
VKKVMATTAAALTLVTLLTACGSDEECDEGAAPVGNEAVLTLPDGRSGGSSSGGSRGGSSGSKSGGGKFNKPKISGSSSGGTSGGTTGGSSKPKKHKVDFDDCDGD